jgi:hypothetical protein
MNRLVTAERGRLVLLKIETNALAAMRLETAAEVSLE